MCVDIVVSRDFLVQPLFLGCGREQSLLGVQERHSMQLDGR